MVVAHVGRGLGGCQNGGVTDTTIKPLVDPKLGDGSHDRFAHYVKKADILRSNVEGVEVVALCGKKWIPNRDPDRYPICPTCKELIGAIRGRAGSD